MNKILLITFLLGNTLWVQAQSTKVLTTYRFDFGTERAARGYIAVTPQTIYNERKGYGFHKGSVLEAVSRNSRRKLVGDYITSKEPFFFSINLPDGNYDVKVILGDIKGTSATTVRAECRRLMLDNVRTERKQVITKTFTVHKRDSIIRTAQAGMINKVRLKPGEAAYKHWDNVLTIEFNDSMPKVCGIEIKPNLEATTVFLTGSNSVVDQDCEPWAAWGQMLPIFFAPGPIVIANYAEAGETLRDFAGERRLDKIWSLAKPGDYLFIEFNLHDQFTGPGFHDPFTTYKAMLKQWITEAYMRQVIPVLVTSVDRKSLNSGGKDIDTLCNEYAEVMRQVAVEERVPLIDLNGMSEALYEAWGPESAQKVFAHYAVSTRPGQYTVLKDSAHFNTFGAFEMARCVVRGIADANLDIARYIIPDKMLYTPSPADLASKWYWPLSPMATTLRPGGN
jgi:lysophospholipase L1-like esterase